MSDNPNNVEIAIVAELSGLQSGLRQAESAYEQSGRRMEAIASKTGRDAGAAFSSSMMRETERAQEVFARRANILLSIQAAVGAFKAVEAVSAGVRGEWDKVQNILDGLPMGIGALNQAIRGIAMEISGINDQIAESAKVASGMAERNAGLAATANARSTLAAIVAENAAANASTFSEKERILIAEASRKAKEQQSSMVAGGVDPSVAARIFAETVARETQRISSQITEEQAKSDLERERNKVKYDEIDRINRERRAKEEADAARKARIDAIEDEMDRRREIGRELEKQLSVVQEITGESMIRSLSTSFGTFRFSQGGSANAVANAQIRAAELLAAIERNTAELANRSKERTSEMSLR